MAKGGALAKIGSGRLPSAPVGSDNPGPADLTKLKRYFTEARDLTQDARTNALVALDYYDSDQFTSAELSALNARGQPAITINRIKPAINGIVGVTEKGRSDPRCWPRNPGDDDSADAATDVLRYIADFNRFKRIKQNCFRDMLIPGTMAALVGVDSDKQVTVTQIRWEEFFHDPRSRANDFGDARYLGIAKWMYADDVSAMYPEKADEIELTIEAGGTGFAADTSYQDRPDWSTTGAWLDKKQRRMMVVECYFKDAGWKRAVFTTSNVLEYGPSPYQDHKGRPECPIEAMSAYVDRQNNRYGAVRDMIGPQDEVNKRRSKSVHLLSTTRIEVRDPQAIDVDPDVARKEAARPDGVIPFGWGMAPNTTEFQGNLEMLQEAKAEIERMGPNPAVLGRDSNDSSGRALLARQQSGLTELANIYGALEDWELRIYRQCWGRAKQFWKAPQFIRVTDDEDAPKFVGLNQPRGAPVMDPATGQPQIDPKTGQPVEGDPMMDLHGRSILGYKNTVAEMDVDIEVDTQADTGTIQQEAFTELMQLVGSSPVYQQQCSLATLIKLSPIPHKRAVLDELKQASDQQAQAQAQQQAMAQQELQAKIGLTQAQAAESQARVPLHSATGFAKTLDSLTYSHQAHADQAAKGLEQGIAHGQAETDRAHEVGMAAMGQAGQAQSQQADQQFSADQSDQDRQHQAGMQADSQAATAEQQQAALEAKTDQSKGD